MKRFLFLLSFFAISVYAEGKLVFSNEVYQIGKMKQGETRHIVLDGKNTGDATILLETAMTQGVGGSDFKFPKKIQNKLNTLFLTDEWIDFAKGKKIDDILAELEATLQEKLDTIKDNRKELK